MSFVEISLQALARNLELKLKPGSALVIATTRISTIPYSPPVSPAGNLHTDLHRALSTPRRVDPVV
jgi:hypothetical protein